MVVVSLKIQLHPSIRADHFPESLVDNFEDVTIIEAIRSLVAPFPDMAELVLDDNEPRPGLLFIADQTELTSMGLLDSILDEDIFIRIVPILHGG